jgi:hypothetical protein
VVTIGLWLAIRYPIERTRVGQIEWLASQGWTVSFAAAGVLAAAICVTLWKSRVARSSVWPQLTVVLLILLFGWFLLQRVGTTRTGVLYAARNFYGVIRVVQVNREGARARQLMHGTTTHGVQVEGPRHRAMPTAYYSPSSGISLAATRLVRRNDILGQVSGVHFGIVGMGIGTMSAFAQAGDRVRYYEINPEVIDVAHGQSPYFTFVKDSAAQVTVVAGDARLSLERELAGAEPQRFDLLVMDAFASDSVPVHLVTVEAFRLYEAHLKAADSILAVNVTNRYIDLEPVIAANARELGFQAIRVDGLGDPPVPMESSWILMSRSPRLVQDPAITLSNGRPLRAAAVRFTDNYSNLFRVLK